MTRLETAYNLIDKCNVFADIGCDHGKLCKKVLDGNKAEKVIAVDISNDSLNKARRLLQGYSNVEFRLCDGLDNGNLRADTIAICGLGGLTVKKILQSRPLSALILGAQDHLYELRSFLCENGYAFVEDFVIKEGKRYYDFIKAIPGNSALDENQKEYGAFCYEKKLCLVEKLERLREKYNSYPKTEENNKKIKIITEILNC